MSAGGIKDCSSNGHGGKRTCYAAVGRVRPCGFLRRSRRRHPRRASRQPARGGGLAVATPAWVGRLSNRGLPADQPRRVAVVWACVPSDGAGGAPRTEPGPHGRLGKGCRAGSEPTDTFGSCSARCGRWKSIRRGLPASGTFDRMIRPRLRQISVPIRKMTRDYRVVEFSIDI